MYSTAILRTAALDKDLQLKVRPAVNELDLTVTIRRKFREYQERRVFATPSASPAWFKRPRQRRTQATRLRYRRYGLLKLTIDA